jgi:hypothetical protein
MKIGDIFFWTKVYLQISLGESSSNPLHNYLNDYLRIFLIIYDLFNESCDFFKKYT